MATRQTKRTTRARAATTADVVGSPRRKSRVPARWKEHHDQLVKLRNHLTSRQEDLVKDAAQEQTSFSLHMADAGTDSFDRDLALSRMSSEQDAVYEIDQALNRIRDGSYGVCELTGRRIEADRLRAIPWTRFSIDAERKLEAEGVIKRAGLGEPEPMDRGTDAGAVAGEPAEPE